MAKLLVDMDTKWIGGDGSMWDIKDQVTQHNVDVKIAKMTNDHVRR